ncbi:MAG: FAD-dependent oxidoreductase [Proteobacteria bacterium]|nr:FAD-dependent oxidoreductase [Pseudomonadota bacterium]
MTHEFSPTRRGALTGMAAAVGASVAPSTALAGRQRQTARRAAGSPDVLVVGAGVFGAWTAWHLLHLGKRVLLVDAWDPAHSRASSGGESRMHRTAYGPDALYSRSAWESLADWRWLSARAGLPVFHPTGVLFMSSRVEPYFTQSQQVHRALGIPLQVLDRQGLQARYPMIDFAGIEVALFEPGRGALMARRGVETLVAQFVAAGGEYRRLAIRPPATAEKFEAVVAAAGERLHAGQFVFACGPWLPKVFPDLLGERIFPTRQEAFFISTPPGDSRFGPASLPGWADFNGGDVYYGFPDLEGRGFKIAHDRHGPAFDPDSGDRIASAGGLQDVRAFMRRRFPDLAGRPLNESRVCQYENSSNGDFLIDRHPSWQNVWLLGAGSGHGFKHGPAVGRYAARRITGTLPTADIEPRFSLASKQTQQHRSVI